MTLGIRKSAFLLPLVFLIFLTSCATLPQHDTRNNLLAYSADYDQTITRRHLPVFIIENYNARHNLIGTASTRITEESNEEIFINPETASIYTETRRFKTPTDSYTNLIYRIHFEKVPSGFSPFHLGSGKNVGLIVVVTLNREGMPILYTTVQTCGCYLAFTPTSYMPPKALPDFWNKNRQTVYWENLPGLLEFKDISRDQAITAILIRKGSHRVKDIFRLPKDSVKGYKSVKALLQPLKSLQSLPLKGRGSTSFYENSGPRKGYVKGSFKPRERLLISWWALDRRVGEDKKLGRDKEDGPIFYTSLKPWARDDSDMRVFPNFLKYWGWKL